MKMNKYNVKIELKREHHKREENVCVRVWVKTTGLLKVLFLESNCRCCGVSIENGFHIEWCDVT